MLSLHLSDPKLVAVVTGLGAVGVLILLVAVLNYINLATARAGLRAREVALRRIMGATGRMLMVQFLAEACAMAIASTVLGLALCEVTLPAANAAAGVALRLDYLGDPLLLVVILAVIAAVGLGGGAYPAFALSRFRPAAVLASARSPGGGRQAGRVREALVAIQFVIAIGFTVYASFEAGWTTPDVMPEPSPSEEVLGGHEVLVCGYLAQYPEHFLVRNSWGDEWGLGGYFLFPSATLLNPSMASDFRTIVRVVAP